MSEKYKALDSGDWSDFSWNKQPKCPHCGGDFGICENEAWDLYDDNNTHDVECPLCDMVFQVNSHAEWRFSTDEQDRDDD